MVQLLLVYFGLLSPLGVSALIVAILVFGLNSGAYVAEIIRSGIQAVDKGTDGSGPLPRIELRRYDEKNHFASGGQEHPAGFGQ